MKTANSKEEKPKVSRSEIVFLFEKYLKNTANYRWQSKVAKRLVEKNGFPVWRYVNIGFKLNSLTFFDSEQGRKILEKARRYLKEATFEKKVVDIQQEMVYTPEAAKIDRSNLKQRLLS